MFVWANRFLVCVFVARMNFSNRCTRIFSFSAKHLSSKIFADSTLQIVSPPTGGA